MILKRTGVIQTKEITAEAAASRPDTGWNILPPGMVLQERYEIQNVLGHGGMSTVYRARDRRFASVERLVAIKEMFNPTQDAAARRLRLATFEREANLLATLQHGAIPKIYDFFTFEGRIYLVLELIAGNNLETVLEQRRNLVSEKDAADWGDQVCELLAYLHGHQPDPIVFRDLKPSNIMLRDDGRHIVMVDFGIARTFQSNQRGTMIGTEGYAPPEQYRGLATIASDIYALGATLHHLATGNDPRLETPFTFHQRPPRQLNPVLSEAFEAVILKATAYNANHRYETAAAMQAAVIASQTRPTPGMRPGVTATTSAAPVTGDLATPARPSAVPASLTNALTTSKPVRPAPIAPVPGGRRSKPGSSASLGTVADASTNPRTRWSVRTGDEVRGSPAVAGDQVYVGSYDGNVYAINRADGVVLWRAAGSRGICSTPAVTGSLVIYGSEDGSIYAGDRISGRRTWSYRTSLPVRSSPRLADEHVYIGSDDGYVYCLEIKGGTLVWRTRTWSHVRSTAAVLDRLAVIGSDDGYLYAVDRETGGVLWRFQTRGPIIATPTIADGLVIVGSMDGRVYAVRSDGGERAWQVTTGQPVVAGVTVRDGVGYVGSVSGQVCAIRLTDGEVLWQYADPSQVTSTAAIDDDCLYVGSGDGHLRCLSRADGRVRWQVKTGGPITSSPAMADGVLYVGSTDRHLYAFSIDSEST